MTMQEWVRNFRAPLNETELNPNSRIIEGKNRIA